MKKIGTLLFTLLLPLLLFAQRYTGYGRGSDGNGGFFIITGDNAVSGVLMLVGFIVTSFICYKIAEFISEEGKTEGFKNTVSNILYAIGGIACIAVIALAFTLWWITLILFVIALIGSAIYQKIEDRRERNKKTSSQEAEKKEVKATQTEKLDLRREPATATNVKDDKILNEEELTNDGKYEINTLTVEQKSALLGMAAFLGTSFALKNRKNEADKILGGFRCMLKLSNEDLKKINFEQLVADRQKCIDIVRTIHKDWPFIAFIVICMQLAEIDNFSIFIDYDFQKILREVGFAQKEIQAINNKDYIFRFENKN